MAIRAEKTGDAPHFQGIFVNLSDTGFVSARFTYFAAAGEHNEPGNRPWPAALSHNLLHLREDLAR
jgi:hypothetical protein